MGLGKTMVMLGLMMSNPMQQPPKNGSYFPTKATLGKFPPKFSFHKVIFLLVL
jgi:hypothetical protein